LTHLHIISAPLHLLDYMTQYKSFIIIIVYTTSARNGVGCSQHYCSSLGCRHTSGYGFVFFSVTFDSIQGGPKK